MARIKASEVKIEGIDELIATLAQLTPEIQNKSGRSAMRRVSLEMSADLKANAPVGETGNLKNAVMQRASVHLMSGAIVAFAKVKYGADAGPHAHLVELGHALVKGKYLGRKTIGFVEAHPFMKPTLYNGRQKWVNIAAEGVEQALQKLKKKGAF